MEPKSPTDFPSGVIDIFKLKRVFELNMTEISKKGNVKIEMDKEIGRNVVSITGNLAPANTIEIPNPKYSKGFNLFGKYYYIFFKGYSDHKFSFQLNFVFNKINTVRFIFKYPFHQLKCGRTNSYNIEIPIYLEDNKKEKWFIFKLDPSEFINTNLFDYRDFSILIGVPSENIIFKSFDASATISLRGIYISNVEYKNNTLPKEIVFKTPRGSFNDYVNLYEIKMEEESEFNGGEEYKQSDLFSNSNILNKNNILSNNSNKDKKNLNDNETTQNENKTQSIKEESIENKKETFSKMFTKEISNKIPLLPEPIMHLSYILGYTAKICPKVQFQFWNEHKGEQKDTSTDKKIIYFCSGQTLIKYDPFRIKQTFYFGNSQLITCYIFACYGEILITAQEGTNSLIRLWRTESGKCFKILTTPFDKIKSLSVDLKSMYLCSVGILKNKECFLIWNITNLNKITFIIQQPTISSISYMLFSPYEQTILITCGRENIKFWRIKGKQILSRPVVLQKHSKNVTFNCMALNALMFGDEKHLNKGRLHVGASNGCVYIISCESQEVEAIYKIQNVGILSIAVNDIFCATGAEDGYLRAWPVDFSEFLIEAKHESGVCSVDISFDSFEILCGTLNGSIGLLNIKSKKYNTLLRTPPSIIQKMIVHSNREYLLTIEDEYAVRVWNIESKSEAFQYLSTRDKPIALASPEGFYFACGFESGILRVFDLNKTQVIYECKAFQSSIANISYCCNDKYLISLSSLGNMSIHEVYSNYVQKQLLTIEEPPIYNDISISILDNFFATIGEKSKYAIVWNINSFSIKNRVKLEPQSAPIIKLCLLNQNIIGMALEDCNIRFYLLTHYEGVIIKEIRELHLKRINTFFISNNLKYIITGGEDGIIKILNAKMIFNDIQCMQKFIGHLTGITAVVVIEGKSLLISSSKNSGIYFWNFLGNLVNEDQEIAEELEKINYNSDSKREKSIISFSQSRSKLSGSVDSFIVSTQKKKNSLNNTRDINLYSLERTYHIENPEECEQEQIKEKKVIHELPKRNLPNTLPILYDKKDINVIYSNVDDTIQQEEIDYNQKDNKKFSNDEIYNSLLFHTKYNPKKIPLL